MIDQCARLYIVKDIIDDIKQVIVFITHRSQIQRKEPSIGKPCRFSDLEKLRRFLMVIGVNAWAKPTDEYPKSEIAHCNSDQFIDWLRQDPTKLDQRSIVLLVLDVSQEEIEKRFQDWQNENTNETAP